MKTKINFIHLRSKKKERERNPRKSDDETEQLYIFFVDRFIMFNYCLNNFRKKQAKHTHKQIELGLEESESVVF